MIRLKRLKRPAWALPSPESSRAARQGKEGMWRIGLIVTTIAVIAGFLYWAWQSRWIVTTGRVMARQVMITAPTTGRLVAILVREGESVRQGQLLARLDNRELQAELRRAEAQAAQVRARLRALEATGVDPTILSLVAAAKRDVRLAKQRYEQAKRELHKKALMVRKATAAAERWERLRLLRAATQAEWEDRVMELQVARTEVEAARSRLSETLASYRSASVLLRHAEQARLRMEKQLAGEREALRLAVAEAEAEVEAVRSRLAQLEVYAPQDGVVSWLPRSVGEIVKPLDRIMTLMDPSDLWIEAYVDGEELAAVKDGNEAWIAIEDVLDDDVPGRVSLMYPADSRGDRRFRIGPDEVRSPTRVASLIHPIKIRFEESIPDGLQPEMVAYVWIAR